MPDSIPILNVEDALDRHALLQAHNSRCRYCGEPLSLRNLEIDHIIPLHLRTKPAELADCLTPLGLPGNYDLNSIDNLLPAHRHCNREKRGVVRDVAFLRHFRELAKEAAPRWTTLRERLVKNRNADSDVAAVVNHVSEGIVSLQEVADIATRKQPFNAKDDFQKHDFIRLSEPHVRIDCQLPTEAKPAGSASIIFHSLNLRGAQIQVNHETLTRELFCGLHAPVKSHWRSFLMKPWKTKPIYYLQIGSINFQLELEEATQLCLLLDRLHPIYAAAFKQAEIAYSGLNSPLKAPGKYEIASIPMALWQQMEAFIRRHDLAKGHSEWHIFDAPAWVWLKVIKRTPTWWEYQCFMDVVMKRPSADARNLHLSEVSLRWDFSKNHPGGRSHATGWCWSVKECEVFMFEKLIPKVVSANWLEKPTLVTQANDAHIFRMSGHEYVTAAGLTSPEKAATTFERLQHLYSLEHYQFVPSEVLSSTFSFLSFLLQHHQFPSYSIGYMGPNLRCGGATSRDELIIQTNRLLQRARRGGNAGTQPVTTGATVDYALRCILEVLRKGEPDRAVNCAWASWTKLLEPLVDDYNQRNYLVRIRAVDFDDN